MLVNAIDGSSQYYPVSEVPTWIDRVYNADLIIEQFDYYGTLRHGYWNSVFGQKDCRKTTDGYNYVALDDDVYICIRALLLLPPTSPISVLFLQIRGQKKQSFMK